jgi:hypothetical protein
MSQVEKDIKEEFSTYRELESREIYLLNPTMFKNYEKFIKEHPLFIKEIPVEDNKKEVIKIVQQETQTLEERGLTMNQVIQKAKRVKDDEFYTQYKDVEKELSMYDKTIWNDKVVFCNCDDAVDTENDKNTSAFVLYFLRNFKELGLKKLICTHYASKVDLFNQGPKGYVSIFTFTSKGFKEEREEPKNYDGSFDHPISIKILNEEADIVCTNPPFSKAIEYWKLVIESGKKFLFIGNFINIIQTAFIHYFKDNKIWPGYNRVLWFLNPKRQLVDAPGIWYTNFLIKNRPRYKNLKIVPLKDIPEKHKRFDDSKTLLVDNCYIPSNYKKPFAVSAFSVLNGVLEKGYKIVQDKRHNVYINGEEKFARVLIQKM